MLTISVARYAALNEAAVEQFRDRLVTWLQAAFPGAELMTRDRLHDLVVRQEPRAARFGLVSERDQAKWCWLSLATDERLDEQLPVVAFLYDDRVGRTPSERLDALAADLAEALSAREGGVTWASRS